MSQTEVQLIKDAVIVNADISNSAAIDVSKISGALPAAGGTITGDVTFDGETAGRDIVFDRSDNALEFADNSKLKFGNGGDLEIYHDGSQSVIGEIGTGNLVVNATSLDFFNNNLGGSYARFISNGAVELYDAGSKKFETTSAGIEVTGNAKFPDNGTLQLGAGNDLSIFHNGTDSHISSITNSLRIRSDAFKVMNANNNEAMIYANANGSVELFHDNSKKFETTSDGTITTGVLKVNDATSATDGNRIAVGTSQDIKIYHIAGNDSYIRNATGDFYLQGNNSGTIVNNIKFENSNGATELYFNGAKKLDTTSTGVGLHGLSLATQNHVLYYNSSSGQVSYEAIAGGGKVLQVLQTTSNNASTSSGSFQDAGLSQAITMTNSANKILVIATGVMNNSSAGSGGGVSIFRGSTNLAHSNDVMGSYFGEDNSNNIDITTTIHKLDTPGSGTHTYAVKLRAFSGTQKFGYRNTGVLTVIELDFS